jgi:CRP-like cAMP-binding protein
MKHVLFVGNWRNNFDLPGGLLAAGFAVSLLPISAIHTLKADLALVRVAGEDDLTALRGYAGAWLAWCDSDSPKIAAQAYQAGALTVFALSTPAEVILLGVQRALTNLASREPHVSETMVRRRFQRGDIILLEPDTVLEVEQGVIAQTMVHEDGAAVLLGLCGPGQIVIPHPDDTCYIHLVAHTDTVATINSWAQASRKADFSEKLRARLQQMEAWSSMQSRPHLDQRIMGILSLLAEQFGTPAGEAAGTVVDVRITHTQLASAVGATRTTVTRTLGNLRKQGLLSLISTADGERYCLMQWEHGHHSFHPEHELSSFFTQT